MEIRKTMDIDAPIDVVFRAISDEKDLVHWFPSIATLEPRVGGKFEFNFQRNDGTADHEVVGEILEFVPNKRFSYTWRNISDPSFPQTVVTWALEPLGKTATRVILVHTGFSKGRWHDLHDSGWAYFIDRLKKYSTNSLSENTSNSKQQAEIRKSVMVDAPPGMVFSALTDESELPKWFPNQGASLNPRVGGAIEFRFLRPDGERHTFRGKILEFIPAKRLSYTWGNAHTPSPDGGTITWILESSDGQKTRVTVIHAGLMENKQDVEKGWSYEAGWTYFLSQLITHCKSS
jgi:uncharacterized protein YndB with AHSA1/START domain